MKQFVKKALLPLAVFVVAVVSAFAINTPSTSAAPEQIQPLYSGPFCYFHPTTGICTNQPGLNPVTLDCTLINTQIQCTIVIQGANVLLRACMESPPNSGIWNCVMPLFKRTMLRAS